MNKWIAEFELEDGDTMPEHMDLEYKGARLDYHCKPLEQARPTGKWFDRGSLSCRCSECGCKSPREYDFCPNCGSYNGGKQE